MMNQKRVPTNGENVSSRLFLRFFLCYALAVPIGWLLGLRGVLPVDMAAVGGVELLFVLLALLGGLLILTTPYLPVLAVLKGLYDMIWLRQVTARAMAGEIGLLQWNLCFVFLAVSLLLFCLAAARAALFSFLCAAKNMRLFFSRTFGRYLCESMLLSGIASFLYFAWPTICRQFDIFSTS